MTKMAIHRFHMRAKITNAYTLLLRNRMLVLRLLRIKIQEQKHSIVSIFCFHFDKFRRSPR